jgi:hypothetical protein
MTNLPFVVRRGRRPVAGRNRRLLRREIEEQGETSASHWANFAEFITIANVAGPDLTGLRSASLSSLFFVHVRSRHGIPLSIHAFHGRAHGFSVLRYDNVTCRYLLPVLRVGIIPDVGADALRGDAIISRSRLHCSSTALFRDSVCNSQRPVRVSSLSADVKVAAFCYNDGQFFGRLARCVFCFFGVELSGTHEWAFREQCTGEQYQSG